MMTRIRMARPSNNPVSTKVLNKAQLSAYALLGDAAKETGVHRSTLWRWIRAGKLHSLKMGREVLIEKAELERLRRVS